MHCNPINVSLLVAMFEQNILIEMRACPIEVKTLQHHSLIVCSTVIMKILFVFKYHFTLDNFILVIEWLIGVIDFNTVKTELIILYHTSLENYTYLLAVFCQLSDSIQIVVHRHQQSRHNTQNFYSSSSRNNMYKKTIGTPNTKTSSVWPQKTSFKNYGGLL